MKQLNKGFTLVELLVVIGILGILMSALFPAISSAMLSAQTNALSMHGRNLFIGITQANVDRESHGRESVWPKKNGETAGGNGDDIADNSYQDANKYFVQLFDMENYGTSDWSPFVDVDIKFLSGAGVPAYRGDKQLTGCVAWTVVADLTDDMPDVIPVLVSRNLKIEKFYVSGSNNKSDGETTQLDTYSEFPQPFGKKASVIIHKGGAAMVYKGRYQSLSDIYDKQTVTFADGSEISYLKPTSGK